MFWFHLILVLFPIVSARIHEREVEKIIDMDSPSDDIWNEINEKEERAENISTRSNALDPTVSTFEFNGKRFYIFTQEQVNWFQAVRRCKQHGLNLASLPDYDEDTAILNYIKSKNWGMTRFWVGGTDLGENKLEYYWLRDGNLFKRAYVNWAAGEPNGGGEDPDAEHCVEINFREQWNDYVCNATNLFICEEILSPKPR